MLRTIFAIAALLIASPAHAQSTQAALQSQITSTLPDNTTGAITPAILRSMLNAMVLSSTCAGSGNVLYWNTGLAPTCSTMPILGASGTLGSVTFGNATSGLLTLAPVTGALGTVTISLPAATGTVPLLNLAQSFTAKQTITFDGGGSPLLQITGTGTQTANGFIGVDGTAGKQTGFNLYDGGTIKWQLIKQTDNTFLVFDGANSVTMMAFNPGAIGAGFVAFSNTLEASSTTVGALTLAGGLAVAKKIFAQSVNVGNSIINQSNPQLLWSGLKGGGNSWSWQTVDSDGRFRIFENTTGNEPFAIFQGALSASVSHFYTTLDATTATAAGIVIDGGAGVAKKLYVGTDINAVGGNVVMGTATKTLTLKQGANGVVGTFICTSGGTITINNSNVAVTDAIIISLNTVGGTISTNPTVNAITAATSFTAKCATSDTSTYNYAIIKNAA